jgi:hypothetical protein
LVQRSLVASTPSPQQARDLDRLRGSHPRKSSEPL